jgi:hypothetical protein
MPLQMQGKHVVLFQVSKMLWYWKHYCIFRVCRRPVNTAIICFGSEIESPFLHYIGIHIWTRRFWFMEAHVSTVLKL